MAGKEIKIYGEDDGTFKIRPYEHHAKYYETDQMGIIHHSNYIKWMEEARMDLMEQIGLSYKQMEEMEIISPVLSVFCEYHSMVHFDDTVVIETKITKYNGIKMEVEYRMTDKETGGAAHDSEELSLLPDAFRQTDFTETFLSGAGYEVL